MNSAGQELGSHHGKLTVVRISEDETFSAAIEISVLVGIIDDSSSSASAPRISSVRLTSRPGKENTYVEGEEIAVEVLFREPVGVSGTPRMSLTVGDQVRQADGVGSVTNQCGGYARILFRYEVQADDLDADGIGLAADALTLNGGTIRSLTGTNANLDLGEHAIATARGHHLDGSLVIAPKVSNASIQSRPQNGMAYGAGEWIRVSVRFDREIAVSGTQQLALTIGSQTRRAIHNATGTTTLWFRYAVQSDDTDGDGIAIAADALTLNVGTICSAAGPDADLDLGGWAIANADDHAVDRSTPATLVVTRLRIQSEPQDGMAYGEGEEDRLRVDSNAPIRATDAVQLPLDIGAQSRQAILANADGSTLQFSYEVQSIDHHSDGLSIPASAIHLNGGSINSRHGAEMDLSLGTHVITNAANHEVRGGA